MLGVIVGCVLQSDSKHSVDGGRGFEWQIEQSGRAQSGGAAACRLVVAEGPVCHRPFFEIDIQFFAGRDDFELFPIGQEDHDFGLQAFPEIAEHCAGDGNQVGGGGEIAAQVVEACGLHLAQPQGLSPFPASGYLGADDQPNDKKTGKGHQILAIGDI